MLSSSSSSTRGAGAALDHVLFVFVDVGLGLSSGSSSSLIGRAGGLLADLAFAAFVAFLGAVDLLGGRALGQHRLEVEDLAQLHRPSLRAFDHSMIALKVIGLSHRPQIIVSRPASMRLAMAISPSRLSNSTAPISRRYMRTGSSVRSTASFLVAAAGRGPPSSSGSTSSSGSALLVVSSSSRILVVLDDVDAHLGDRGHDVLDLLGGHLVLRQRLVDFLDR